MKNHFKMKRVGIDPGFDGAVAIINDGEVTIYDTPYTTTKVNGKKRKLYDVEEMAHILKQLVGEEDCHVYLEKVHSMPKEGVVGAFSFGEGFGIWKGILSALEIPYTLITPQEWKGHMIKEVGAQKSISCFVAQQLFPNAQLFGPRGGGLDGRGDALLMAEYCRRKVE